MALQITFTREPVNQRQDPTAISEYAYVRTNLTVVLSELPQPAAGEDPHVPEPARFAIAYFDNNGALIDGALIEVATTELAPNQFYVDYDAGRILFHYSFAGVLVEISYYGTGSSIIAEDVSDIQRGIFAINDAVLYRAGVDNAPGTALNAMNADLRSGGNSITNGLVDGVGVAAHYHDTSKPRLHNDSLGTIVAESIEDNAITVNAFASTSFLIPSGCIFLWSGSQGAIPDGWAICNGANGTPDLRDRFVIGAGSTYAPGNTGGSTSHVHTLVTHNHTLNAHTHVLTHEHPYTTAFHTAVVNHPASDHAWSGTLRPSLDTPVGRVKPGLIVAANNAHNHTMYFTGLTYWANPSDWQIPAYTYATVAPSQPASTSASATTTTGDEPGSLNSTQWIPPYYALFYIMKL